jgi:2'-hydroxyisoflavone reductase
VRILVIGGTQFIGRHIVEAALAAGDEVTCFHRGRTNPGLFPEASHLIGDRDQDLSALDERAWDATIDTSAYVPRQVRALAAALGGRGGQYVHISSVSAYALTKDPGGTEDLPLAELDDPETEKVNAHTYGGLKALCERAAVEAFGGGDAEKVTIVRPTYVAGPYDHTYRFTWWVERVAQGGSVLAPGPQANPFQVIDVRDVAAFVLLLAHEWSGGAFHAVNPAPPFSFGSFLETVVATVGPAGTELVWVDSDWLAARGINSRELPLWEGTAEGRNASALDPSRANARGLVARPLAETVMQLHAAEAVSPTPSAGIGFDPDRETRLLSEWVAR